MPMGTVFCVLKSGGDFDVDDVVALQSQLKRHRPGTQLHCLSDIDVPCFRFSLKYSWPGWWSKMELFRPDIEGDIFYIDLDSVIVGDISDLICMGADTMLSDFYYPDRPASGLMYITEKSKAAVWHEWLPYVGDNMQRCRSGGDQAFLGSIEFGRKAYRWQQEFPGQVISYKTHMRPKLPRRGVALKDPPKNARIVCFHGQPRPKHLSEPWIMEARRA